MSAGKVAYRLAAMGDVMLSRNVGKHYMARPDDFLLNEISSFLKYCDLIFVNLETPVSTKGVPHHIQDPNVTFCAHPDTLRIIKNLGVNIVSLGNNHMLDYGEEALCETLEHLDHYGINYVGAGQNYEEANRPLLLEINSKRVAFLSHVFIYSASTKMAEKKKPGVSDYRIHKILPRIYELKKNGYKVIISVHWGMEYSFYPLPYQMKQARQMIDSGASLILGHGPHYPQGIESYKNGQIVYSLGNFIFDEPHKFANRSFIYNANITDTDEITDIQIYPVHIKNHIPTFVDGKEKEHLKSLIYSLGKVYSEKGKKFWKKINNNYFRDIVNRVIRMRSTKFIFLPPISFYFSIGVGNFFKKLNLMNLKSLLTSK